MLTSCNNLKRTSLFLLFLVIGIIPSIAQDKGQTEIGEKFIKAWKRHKIYTLQLAEAMPEERFKYKINNETLTFGEILMHIAGANYMFSSLAGQHKNPTPAGHFAVEGKSKTDIIKILTESFDYSLERLLKATTSDLLKTTPWGNPIEASTTRTGEEVFHVMREHAAHHRGQLGVYLRLKGITPPPYID